MTCARSGVRRPAEFEEARPWHFLAALLRHRFRFDIELSRSRRESSTNSTSKSRRAGFECADLDSVIVGKILVIRGGAIGDFILTLPVLAALRRHFPRSIGCWAILRRPLASAGGLRIRSRRSKRGRYRLFCPAGVDERLAQFLAPST